MIAQVHVMCGPLTELPLPFAEESAAASEGPAEACQELLTTLRGHLELQSVHLSCQLDQLSSCVSQDDYRQSQIDADDRPVGAGGAGVRSAGALPRLKCEGICYEAQYRLPVNLYVGQVLHAVKENELLSKKLPLCRQAIDQMVQKVDSFVAQFTTNDLQWSRSSDDEKQLLWPMQVVCFDGERIVL